MSTGLPLTSALFASRTLPEVTPRFNPWVNKAFAVLAVLLLFTFKINLVSISGQSAGLRFDDVLILGMGTVLAAGWLVRWRLHFAAIEHCFFLLIIVFLISNFWNLAAHQQSSLLYTLRMCEYFLFFYFGIYYAGFFRLTPLISTWLAVNGALMVLQTAHVIGGFASAGYEASSSRAMGLTGGPWEVGALVNFCFAILLSSQKKPTAKKALLLFAVTFGLLLLTGARMPTVAHIVILLLFLKRTSQNAFSAMLKFTIPAAIILFLLIIVPNPITERSSKLFSFANIQLLAHEYQVIPIPDAFNELPALSASDANTDFSWMVRAVKWAYVTKLWINQPVAWFIGVGPGTVGIAMDGGWLRLVVEEGLLGTACFLALFHAISKLHIVLRDITVALFTSMIMIDIHIAYKAMSFVFFVTGCFYQQKRNNQRATLVCKPFTLPPSSSPPA